MADNAPELPYMPLWTAALLADTEHFTLDEFGGYMRLLCFAWKHGSIPAESKRRATLLGVTPARERAIWKVLGDKWRDNGDGGLVNGRQEEERAKSIAAHRARVAAGSKGGKAKAARNG